MPPNSSTLAHQDIRAAMDRALENGRGVRISCDTPGDVYNLRQRFYTVRRLDRADNAKTYDTDHPLYGRSVYDTLIVYPASEGNTIYCVIEVSTPDRLEERIEDL